MNDIEKAVEHLKRLKNDFPAKCHPILYTNHCERIDLAISALEKQIPKKVLYEVEDEQEKSGYQETCPNCHCFVFDDYCARCGQKLDWGDNSEC